MKHAGPDALDMLEPVLARLRTFPMFREKGRGVFYRGSRAFLHFHEDAAGLFVDVRLRAEEDFVRMPVNTRAEQARLLREVRKVSTA